MKPERIEELRESAVWDNTPRIAGDELTVLLDAYEDAQRLRGALEPFAQFSRQFQRKPLSGLDDTLYAIHTGTEYAAEIRQSDLRRAAEVLR